MKHASRQRKADRALEDGASNRGRIGGQALAGLLSLVALGCATPPPTAESQVVIELVEQACSPTPRFPQPFDAIASAQVTLRAQSREHQSSCVAGPFADVPTLQRVLRQAGVGFADLPPEKLEVKVLGYAKEGCQPPVALCGTASFDPAQATLVELPVRCWGEGDAAPFNRCVDGVDNAVVDSRMELRLWHQDVGTTTSPRAEQTTERAHSPEHSLMTSLDEPYDVYWTSRVFSIAAGETYTLRHWNWLESVVADDPSMGVIGCAVWCSELAEPCQEVDRSCGPRQRGTTGGWEAVDHVVTAPPTAAAARIEFSIVTYGGDVWLDDVFLVPQQEP